MGGPACFEEKAGGGANPSLDARMVLLIGGADGGGGGVFGICKRWLQSGQFNFSPAKLAGDSSSFLQRGQL
jgi:hypothetical protein